MIEFTVASAKFNDLTSKEIDPLYFELVKAFLEALIATYKGFNAWFVEINRALSTEENILKIAKIMDGHRFFLDSLYRANYHQNVPIFKAWTEMKKQEFLS